MRQALAELRTVSGLTLRIGIDSGPVVAGVIGRTKFGYDIWGDTVNTASRMESHAAPGTIQVTERTHRRLERLFVLERRPGVAVKGKGEMTTYVLLAERRDDDGPIGEGERDQRDAQPACLSGEPLGKRLDVGPPGFEPRC